MSVRIRRALLKGVYIRAPDVWKILLGYVALHAEVGGPPFVRGPEDYILFIVVWFIVVWSIVLWHSNSMVQYSMVYNIACYKIVQAQGSHILVPRPNIVGIPGDPEVYLSQVGPMPLTMTVSRRAYHVVRLYSTLQKNCNMNVG